jgi:hypothetical protein
VIAQLVARRSHNPKVVSSILTHRMLSKTIFEPFLCNAFFGCAGGRHGAHGVVVSHPLSMREALGSIPSVSIFESGLQCLRLAHWADNVRGGRKQILQTRPLFWQMQVCGSGTDTVSEWLRRWTRNPLGSARRGSNPLGVVLDLLVR